MIEQDTTLQCWALESTLTANQSFFAQPLLPHRLVYLDYEGEISGGRGRVIREDSGNCVLNEQADRIEIQLLGQRYRGCLRLTQQSPGDNWAATFVPEA